jgi:DNA-binding protein YbaB
MTSPMQDHLERALASLTETRAQLDSITKDLASATTTVRSKDRTVTVVVNASGDVTELTFHGNRYRKLPAAELSAAIVGALAEARRKATATVESAFQPMFGDRTPVSDVLGGAFDFDAAIREATALAESVIPTRAASPSGERDR